MLGKLVKHDLRATARVMLPYLGAMLVLGVLTRFAFPILDKVSGGLPRFLLGLIIGLFFTVLGVSGLRVFILSIERFHRNLLGQEGYLMLTLPATRSQHILAKLLTSLVWYAAAAVCSPISACLAFLDNRYILQFIRFLPSFAEIREVLAGHGADVAYFLGIAAEGLVVSVLALAVFTVMVYAADALGSAFRKHKTLLAFVFAFVFLYLTFWAAFFVITRTPSLFADITGPAILALGGIGIVCEMVVGAVFFFLAAYLLKNKLNLE